MNTINLREQIAPENMTPAVELILKFIGDVVVTTPQSDGEDESLDYEFPNQTESLLILGDDSWGAVTGAFVQNGHLVLVANYGDEGDINYAVSSSSEWDALSLDRICTATTLGDIAKSDGKRVTLTLTPEIAEKQLKLMKDTLTTAIEGGSSYWAEGRNFEREPDLTYVSCELRPSRDEGLPYEKGDPRNDWKHIGPKELEAAMLRIINDKSLCNRQIREAVLIDYMDPDSCWGDAETADAVVQVALFGEIVFG